MDTTQNVARLVLSGSNACALMPFAIAVNHFGIRSLSSFVIASAALASAAYHAVENERPFLNQDSLASAPTAALLLAIDRVAALGLFLHICRLWIRARYPSACHLVTFFVVALLSLGAAELAADLETYTSLHCVWHAMAFVSVAAALLV